MQGVIGRNAQQVHDALAMGADCKALVGKDKMAVVAIRSFSAPVCEALLKAGTSFKDTQNILEALFQTDDASAFAWYTNLAHMKKMATGEEFVKINLFFAAVRYGSVKIVERLSSNPAAAQWLQGSQEKVFPLLANALSMTHPLSRWILSNTSTRQQHQAIGAVLQSPDTTLAQLQELQALSSEFPTINSIVKSVIGRTETYVSHPNVLHLPIFSKIAKKSQYSVQLNIDSIGSVFEYLVHSFHPLLVSALSTEKGKEQLKDIFLRRPCEVMAGMGCLAEKNVRSAMLQALNPLLSQWRDEDGNNAFHYMLARTQSTKVLVDELYGLNPALLIESNTAGKTPLSFLDVAVAAACTQKIMKKELRAAGVSAGSSPAPRRRM